LSLLGLPQKSPKETVQESTSLRLDPTLTGRRWKKLKQLQTYFFS
jgi:hypothetical protein